MNPYRARQNTTTLIVIEYGLALYIYDSACLRKCKRNDGSSVDLSSGLCCPYPSGSGLCLSCSRSVGILLIMKGCRKANRKDGAF